MKCKGSEQQVAKRRVNITMEEELYAKIKEYAEMSGISVAGAIAVLCSNDLETKAAMKMSIELMKNPEFIEYLKNAQDKE